MNSADLIAEVRRWMRFAREDLTAAESITRESDAIPRHAC